jgi:hypothetical protein
LLYNIQDEINDRINRFGNNQKFKSIPRDLTQIKKYKASDYLIFLFYLMPIVLRGLIRDDAYGYYMILVYSISNFWQRLNKDEIDFNHNLIRIFLEDLSIHFSESEYTISSHLRRTICKFGPMFMSQMFIYESKGGNLGRLFHSHFGITKQIAKRCTILFNLDLAEELVNEESSLKILYIV